MLEVEKIRCFTSNNDELWFQRPLNFEPNLPWKLWIGMNWEMSCSKQLLQTNSSNHLWWNFRESESWQTYEVNLKTRVGFMTLWLYPQPKPGISWHESCLVVHGAPVLAEACSMPFSMLSNTPPWALHSGSLGRSQSTFIHGSWYKDLVPMSWLSQTIFLFYSSHIQMNRCLLVPETWFSVVYIYMIYQ